MQRVDRDVTWVDHLVSLLAVLAVCFVSGNSIGRPNISLFFMPIAVVCGLGGYGLGRLVRGKRMERYDWALYVGLAAIIIFNIRPLNNILPDEGFPFQIVMMSFLTWLMCAGQLVAWRDTTMAFQAVPCIAAFGLVGAFDYQATPYVFFAFLLCMSTLFFRLHARQMLARAEASFALSTEREEMGDRRKLWERAFETGAWRWMAGTGWALSSALLIILLSLIGAPIVQYSVQSVAGRVNFNLDRRPRRQPSFTGVPNPDGTLRLGQGPLSQLGYPLYSLKCEDTVYWRMESFDSYTGRNWRNTLASRNSQIQPFNQAELRALYPAHNLRPFELEPVRLGLSRARSGAIPTPGTVLTMDTRVHTFEVTQDLNILKRFGAEPKMKGQALFAPPSMSPTKSVAPPEYRGAGDLLATGGRTWLASLVDEATEGATTDFQKAEAIKNWIGQRCNYNLKAAAPPSDVDMVEHFLNTSQEGYCDLFASAMTVMARGAGLQARMSSGFLVDDQQPDANGYVTATDKNAHVWCEVYFDKVGWVVFDATANAVDVTPKESTDGAARRDLLNKIIQYGMAGVIVLGLGAVAYAQRRERQQLAGRSPRTQVGELYRNYLRHIERVTQRPCLLAETPLEYIERVNDRLAEGRAEARELATLFTRYLFAPETPSAERLAEIESKVRAARQVLRPAQTK